MKYALLLTALLFSGCNTESDYLSLDFTSQACETVGEFLGVKSRFRLSEQYRENGKGEKYLCVLKVDDMLELSYSGERLMGAAQLARQKLNLKYRPEFYQCLKDAQKKQACYHDDGSFNVGCMMKCQKTGYKVFGN